MGLFDVYILVSEAIAITFITILLHEKLKQIAFDNIN